MPSESIRERERDAARHLSLSSSLHLFVGQGALPPGTLSSYHRRLDLMFTLSSRETERAAPCSHTVPRTLLSLGHPPAL